MDMKIFLISTILLVTFGVITGRVLNRCEMAVEMYRIGISQVELPNYVCIAEREGHGNTSAWRGPGADGSYDWGLFLLSDNWWCDRQVAGKGCMVRCSDLITDDITQAVQCAQMVVMEQGYTAWQSWTLYCQGRLPDLSQCFTPEIN